MPGAATKQQRSQPETPVATPSDPQIAPGAVFGDFEQLCVTTSVSGAFVAVRELTGLRCTVSFGNAPAVGSRLPADFVFNKRCIATGEAALCEDVAIDPRIDRSLATHLNFRSAVAVPMRIQENVVGLIAIFHSRPRAISLAAIAELTDIAKSFAALMIFDAGYGQPIIGGSPDHPVVLSISDDQPPAVSCPAAAPIGRPQQQVDRAGATTAQLPSDRPTPARVWLITGFLLLGVSLLFLFLLRSTQ
jgi:GAF domain